MNTTLLRAALLTLPLSLAAAELPEVGFDQPGWSLGEGMTLEGGVLRIDGGPGYRHARIDVSAEAVSDQTFFFTVEVRLREIEPGPALFARPKVKISHPGPPPRTVRNFQTGECGDWTQVTLQHRLLSGQRPEAVTLEVAMQDCGGVAEFRNPRLGAEHPPVRTNYPFARPAEASASLALDTGAARDFDHRLLGVNQQFTWSPIGYEDPRVQAFIRRVAPPSLRFPAGTVANYYDWTSDGFERPGPGEGPGWLKYVIENDKRFAFDDYLALCRELDLSAPLTFNVLSDTVEESVARLRDRLERGTPIEHIELGNENYFHAQRGGQVDTPEDYLAFTRELAPALRAVDPTIPLAVNVSGEDGHEHGAMAEWNATLAQADHYDLAVLHPYLGLPNARPDTENVRRMLGLARHLRGRIEACHQQFGVPLVLSEWGILAPATGSESVAAAIGIADGFLELIAAHERGQIRSACLHMLCMGDGAQGSGLYGLDRETMTIRTSRRGAIYELLLAAFRDAELLEARSQSSEIAPGLSAVSARAARHPDGRITVLAVNKLDVAAPLALSLDGEPVSGVSRSSYVEDGLAAGQLSWPLGEQPLAQAEGEAGLVLPPLSVSLLTLAP